VFDHVTIRVSDRPASRRFYQTVLEPLGHGLTHSGEEFDEWKDFSLARAGDERPPTRNLHLAFVSRSRERVGAFWQTGVEAGYASDGEPGPRPQYGGEYYGAFLLDPDGNSVEAVHHGRRREGEGVVDHLWIRVADPAASRRFYETIAPVLGLRIGHEQATRFHLAGGDRSLALVRGEPPTANVHLAFPVPDASSAREFHRLALAAGYRDNGPPGERSYHPGYFGAFVLDPDGNNIEAVYHGR
jgi:catechol 2,3-dioxygenase-like lactoylglutathione lyase family enzyme